MPAKATGIAKWTLATLAVVVMFLLLKSRQGPSPEARAQAFASHLANQEWGEIYDMAPLKEREVQPWGRKEFSAFMDALAKTWVAGFPVNVTEARSSFPDVKVYNFAFEPFRGGASAGLRDRWHEFKIRFLQDRDDWRPSIAILPMDIDHMLPLPGHERVIELDKARRASGVTMLVDMQTRVAFDFARLPDYIAGKAKWEDLNHFTNR